MADTKKLRLVVAKGHIFGNVVDLLGQAGIRMSTNERAYRPYVYAEDFEIKIMKPQNIPSLVELGSHDAGFSGYDWVVESGAEVRTVIDLKLDPVKIVAAVSENLTPKDLRRKKIIVASEYENISRKWLEAEGYDYIFLRTFGATEVFPPDDADMIIDNSSTGKTLFEHNLKIIATILESSTLFIANPRSLADSWKKEKIAELKMLFQSIIDAGERVMLEMNIPAEKFETIVKILPCMRSPTVSPLYGNQGFAVKVAVRKEETPRLIPLLKKMGAMDILEYDIRKVIA